PSGEGRARVRQRGQLNLGAGPLERAAGRAAVDAAATADVAASGACLDDGQLPLGGGRRLAVEARGDDVRGLVVEDARSGAGAVAAPPEEPLARIGDRGQRDAGTSFGGRDEGRATF